MSPEELDKKYGEIFHKIVLEKFREKTHDLPPSIYTRDEKVIEALCSPMGRVMEK